MRRGSPDCKGIILMCLTSAEVRRGSLRCPGPRFLFLGTLLMCLTSAILCDAVGPKQERSSSRRGSSSSSNNRILRGRSGIENKFLFQWRRQVMEKAENVGSGTLHQMTESRREPQRDEWCHSLSDGFHADTLAAIPCSGYFKCKRGMLAGLYACPMGTEYSTPAQACVAPSKSSCAHTSSMGDGYGSSSSSSSSSKGRGRGRSMMETRGKKASGFDYMAVGTDSLNATTALLEFKSNVVDFEGVLATWQPSLNGSSNCGAGGPCSGKRSCWNFVKCTAAGVVSSLVIPPSNLSTPLGENSIPSIFSVLTGLRMLSLKGSQLNPLFGLTGSIPIELSVLKSLTFLDLSYNHFTGNLESSGIPSLLSLQCLALHDNWLSGSIPSSLSTLKNLTYLNLARNQFNGSLPTGIGSLTKIIYFGVASNNLSGAIPSGIWNMTGLTELYLGLNQLVGGIPPSVTNLKDLTMLSLPYNRLSGDLPTGLSTLPSLAFLDLTGNDYSGALPAGSICQTALYALNLGLNAFNGSIVPEDFANCSGLNTLNLTSCNLSGPLPPSLFNQLTYLQDMDLSNNSFSGPLPKNLLSLTGLSSLVLSNNSFSGLIPPVSDPALSDPTFCLNNVDLSYNSFSGHLPPSLLNCSTLLGFNVRGNRLNGTLAALVTASDLARLQAGLHLDLSNNRFSGIWPKLNFTGLTGNMSQLNISHNMFTGPIPNLAKYTTLNLMDLSVNNFTGDLEAVIGSIPNKQLGYLNLSSNAFSGPIPASVSTLTSLQILALSDDGLAGPIPASISTLAKLWVLDLSDNLLQSMPSEVGNLKSLQVLDVSNNTIAGTIPDSLAPQSLKSLESLDLSRNQFSGAIPYGFANATPAKIQLNFSNNQLSGPVPNGTLSTEYPSSAFAGNPRLCGCPGLPVCAPPGSGPDSGALSTGAIVGIVLGSAAFLACCVASLWCYLFYQRKQSLWEGGTMLVFEKLDVPLTIDNVLESTENFDEKYMLGKGGFGSVYRGMLGDGRTVAIKRLAAGSGQGQKEFQAEMQTLGNIRHRNLVVLVAAYVTQPPCNEKLLIYEFLSGGSLDRCLVKDLPKDSPFRKWMARRKIIEDTARGLKYLHHDCTPRIVHRDMKPANVLLDDKFGARVADFGLAREFDMSKSHISTSVFGTIGYLAPEYTTRGRLSFKSDVFAFGVVVLQVVTGKQPTDNDVAERGLARWVGGNSALSVCDPRMDDAETNLKEILGVITLGLRCTARVPSDRPSMEEVVYSLDHLHDFARGFGKGKDDHNEAAGSTPSPAPFPSVPPHNLAQAYEET